MISDRSLKLNRNISNLIPRTYLGGVKKRNHFLLSENGYVSVKKKWGVEKSYALHSPYSHYLQGLPKLTDFLLQSLAFVQFLLGISRGFCLKITYFVCIDLTSVCQLREVIRKFKTYFIVDMRTL